jgi:hypothetical protein
VTVEVTLKPRGKHKPKVVKVGASYSACTV